MPTSESITSAPEEGLFLLPAELRNMVYKYILTTPNATLEYTTDDTSGHKQINQLQYVNKQLYKECADLELKLNPTITISSRVEDDTTATEQFFALLAYLPRKKQDWLQTVILHSAAPEAKLAHPPLSRFELIDSRVNMFRLAELCILMPHITVKYKLSTFSARMLCTAVPGSTGSTDFDDPPHPMDVVLFGSAFSDFLRGDSMPELRPKQGRTGLQVMRVAEVLRKWREIHPMYTDPGYYHKSLRADNLRFFPMEEVLKSEEVPGVPDRYFSDEAKTKDLAPLWKAAVRKWVVEGL